MKPRIIFLGTGQGPEVVGKQLRASGGIVIQTGEHQLHIDPGPCSLSMGKEYYVNPRETTALLVSHSHLHHCNDVNVIINSMTHSGLDKKGVLISGSLLINGDSITKPYLTDFHKSCLEKYMVLRAGQRAAIDEVEILATEAKHSVESTGFRIETPSFCVSYVGDTGYTPAIHKQHEGADILILNVNSPGDSESEFNLNSDQAAKIIGKVKPRLSIITHFSLKMLQADPMIEARNISKKTKCQVIAAKDGTVIDPLSYALKRRQKKLNLYSASE
jgi:ribonuclease BN (tRNA processing enzyme)